MPLSTLMAILFALALWVLATPPKPPAKRKAKESIRDGISINIYQQGSNIPPRVVVRDSSKGEQ